MIQWLIHKDSHWLINQTFELIKWVSDSMTRSSRQSLAYESAVWTNRVSQWFNDSFIKTVTGLWISRLNESSESVIQWLIHKDSHWLINQTFELIEWVSDSMTRSSRQSLAYESAVWTNRVSQWFNDSFIKTVTGLWISRLNESSESVIQWLIHKDSHWLMNQPFERIEWVGDSMTHS